MLHVVELVLKSVPCAVRHPLFLTLNESCLLQYDFGMGQKIETRAQSQTEEGRVQSAKRR